MNIDTENEPSEQGTLRNYTSDRFISARPDGNISSIYSIADEIRSQNTRSPEQNRGTLCFRLCLHF